MCPGSCAVFLCSDCQKAARDDKRAAADFDVLRDALGCSGANIDDACIQVRETRAQFAKTEGDAEAQHLRCISLGRQLEEWKRAGLESDRRAKVAEAKAAIADKAFQNIIAWSADLEDAERECVKAIDAMAKVIP